MPAYSNVAKSKKTAKHASKGRQDNDKDGYKHDDTPRVFARMMQLQTSKKRQRSGLDDGNDNAVTKKRRKADQSHDRSIEAAPLEAVTKPEMPKILPGERLGDFAARVDQAMPVGGLMRKGKPKIGGVKEGQTKTEKKLKKMYATWHEEDAKRKEKLEEEKEIEEDAEAEMGVERSNLNAATAKARKGRREDDDPWAELTSKREQRKGLHDVVQAPPNFKALPKNKFKVRNGAKVDVDSIPSTAGSLKRREELSEARREVIERYRAMMSKP